MKHELTLLLSLCSASFAWADAAKVVTAEAVPEGAAWRFNVTISHPDTGWDHYADGWGVYLPDGTELGYRTLYHPHVNEQPFTRSLSGVTIPDGVAQVLIRPRDSVHGIGADFTVTLPNR